MTTNHKENRMILFLLGFLAFWANGDNYAVAPLLVNIARDLGLTVSRASLSVTAYMVAFGFFTIFFGPLGDRFGKGRIIKIAAFGTAVFSILGGFAFNLPSLIVFRAFNGMFGAGIFPVTLALIGERFDEKSRQGAIGSVMGMMFLGGASATLVGGILAQFASWRVVYILYGVAELVLAALVLVKVPSGEGSREASFFANYKTALGNGRLLAVVSIIFFVGFAVFGTFSFSGHYVKTVTGLPIVFVGLVLTAFGAGTVLGGRKAGSIRQFFGRWFLPVAGIAGLLGLAALFLFLYLAVIVPAFFLFGLAFVFLQSTLVMTAQNSLPALRGTAMSLASFNMFVGGAVGTLVNGKIVALGLTSSIYAIAGPVLFAAALAAFFITRERAKSARLGDPEGTALL